MSLPVPENAKRILFGVLNWGLGHATRSIPLIHELLRQGKEVILASDGYVLDYLEEEFPDLETVGLKGYNVTYPTGSIFLNLIIHSPRILSAMRAERSMARQLVRKHNPDMVISDSRFWFRHPDVYSVMISHQLNIHTTNPLFKIFSNVVNKRLLNAFNAVWVPDYPDRRLSGDLSDNAEIDNVVYIGAHSRLTILPAEIKDHNLVILSGPEPKRTELEHIIVQLLNRQSGKWSLVRGSENGPTLKINGKESHIEIIDVCHAEELSQLLNRARAIISRSGYSSVLDYHLLNVPKIIIPTPGQTEQEYLAGHLDGKMGFIQLGQNEVASKLLSYID